MSNLKIFISHASANKDKADEICEYLEKNGKTCWIAPRNIPVGTEYGEEIIKGIETSDVMVLVFSAAANASQHVTREVERAVNKKIPIVAFRIEYCNPSKSMEYFLSSNQWLDASFNTTEMLGPLNSSIEKIYELKQSAQGEGELSSGNAIKVSKKSVPLFIALAVAIVAAIVIIAVAVGNSCTFNTNLNVNPESTDAANQVDFGQGSAKEVKTELNVGEYISFGRYYPTGYSTDNNDGDIKWQVVDIDNENGKMTLLSAEIIDIKPFDCAESGKYGVDFNGNSFDESAADTYSEDEMISFFGNGYWGTSDIRAWLNSSGTVEYYGIEPCDEATDMNANGFGTQEGFLSSFTKDEMDLICETQTEDANTDLVYLLSLDEVNMYMSDDSFILHPSATKSAAASDSSSWYSTYAVDGDYLWATRTISGFNPNKIVIIECAGAHELYVEYDAASSGFGIRPAITLDLNETSSLGSSGDGTSENPYCFAF